MTAVLTEDFVPEAWVLEYRNEQLSWPQAWLDCPPIALSGEPEAVGCGLFVVRALVRERTAMPIRTSVLQAVQRLLGEMAWQSQAKCRGVGWEEFFGSDETGKQPSLHPSVLTRTREEHCSPCVVRRDCLLWALVRGESYGIWGGTSGRQRTAMLELIELRADAGEDRAQVTGELVDAWLSR